MPHIQSQGYSLDGELALSGLTNTDFPNGFSSYQYNLLYIPKVSIVKTVEDDKTIDSDISLRLLRHYSGDLLLHDEQKFYRYWLRYNDENFEARIGLQKIVFGTSQLLRTLSWFDSIDPIDLTGQTTGVRALRLRWYPMHYLSSWAWIIDNEDETHSYGTRVEISSVFGEWGISYHKDHSKIVRNINSLGISINQPNARFAVDYRFDGLVGFWNESAIIKANEANIFMTTLGADYTLPIAGGILITAECMLLKNQFDNMGRNAEFFALMASTPLSINHQIMLVSQVGADLEKMYHHLRWTSTYNYYSLNFICTFYPEKSNFEGNEELLHNSSIGYGTGLQFMLIYNH